MLWPHRYWPQQSAHIDAAIVQAWNLYCHGVIGQVEIYVIETEMHAMRGWVQ